MARTRRDVSGRSGFTLLEVLVAVALSAVIMMALFAMFGSVADVASSVRAREEAASGVRTLEGLLFDDLRSLYAGKETEFRFVGKSGSFLGEGGTLMAFSTTASLGDNSDGASFSLQRVEYVLKDVSGVGTLFRREKRYCGLSGRWPWVEVPVFRGIDELEVAYADPETDSFLSEWASGQRYPASVRVRILGADGEEQRFSVGLSTMARELR
ncbi:prepilin-type N-terminal cleavage/methylation domain-containing protein [Salidesulfovibrio onnuriiensis]|uniref:prepilin-type N-terminal cleavage/methylation domain-containing protein n=1 Tax=Salidesulfovibrio onnuriiensis TaxID=2583823 RepID=UPI0011CC78AC|nr:prepilin-type N-terminal cleavage/methylation domain-containing protein [Salidesulfovibrio onnuriiensis]